MPEIPEVRGRTGATAKLRAIKLNDWDDFTESERHSISSICSALARKTGRKFVQRLMEGGVLRVWRVS